MKGKNMKKLSINFMKKTTLQGAVGIVAILLATIVTYFSFMKNANNDDFANLKAERNHIISIYEKTDYDFMLTYLTENKMTEIGEHESVKAISKYELIDYAYDESIFTLDGFPKLSVLALHDDEFLEHTEFSSRRIIQSADKKENEIYIGNYLHKKADKGNGEGLNLGDKIKIFNVEFEITRIYDYTTENIIYIPGILNLIPTQMISNKNIYVIADDRELFMESFLDPYIPDAKIEDRSKFETDDDYNDYLDDFYTQDHSGYYTDKYANYDADLVSANELELKATREIINYSLVNGAIVLIVMVIYLFAFDYRKMKREKIDSGTRELNIRQLILLPLMLFVSFMSMLIVSVLISLKTYHFIALGTIILSSITPMMLTYLFIFIATGINLILINSGNKRKK